MNNKILDIAYLALVLLVTLELMKVKICLVYCGTPVWALVVCALVEIVCGSKEAEYSSFWGTWLELQ